MLRLFFHFVFLQTAGWIRYSDVLCGVPKQLNGLMFHRVWFLQVVSLWV